MIIKRIAIHNFRSIRDASFAVHDFTLLIGANNAGKSTVVDALRCFYEKDISFKRERDFPKGVLQENEGSWTEIEYLLADNDLEEIGQKYQSESRRLVLRKYFMGVGNIKPGIHSIDKAGNPEPELFYGPKNIPEGKLGSITFIPAVSAVEDFTKLTGPSELQELVLDVLGDVIQEEESNDLTQNMSNFFSRIKKSEGEKQQCSLDSVERSINDELEIWGSEMRFDLKPPSVRDLVKNQLRFKLKDSCSGSQQDACQFGSGFQRHLIYSILKVRALLKQRVVSSSERKVFNAELKILLFEEPEAFLHPDQQEFLFRNLKELSKSGFQVICTSHSPKFLSLNFDDISSLVRIGKVNGFANAYQIGEDEKKKFFDRTRNCPTVVLSDWQMVSIKYSLLMNPLRAEALFAERVLLVEGPSETALINALVSRGELRLPFGTVVIDTLGKFNMARFIILLQKLGIPHAAIIDKDESGEQQVWNKYIEKNKQKLTRCIEYLDPDLERILGLQKNCGLSPDKKHQKPQMLLWHLERNEVPNVMEFRDRVQSVVDCFGDCHVLRISND